MSNIKCDRDKIVVVSKQRRTLLHSTPRSPTLYTGARLWISIHGLLIKSTWCRFLRPCGHRSAPCWFLYNFGPWLTSQFGDGESDTLIDHLTKTLSKKNLTKNKIRIYRLIVTPYITLSSSCAVQNCVYNLSGKKKKNCVSLLAHD